MGTLFIDRKAMRITLDGHSLAFYSNDNREGIVPIRPLKRVIITGNVTLETSVLHRLADSGISVIFLSGKRQRFRGVFHGRLHKNGLLRLNQYRKVDTEFAFDFSKEQMSRKISLQKELLKYAMEHRPDRRNILFQAISTIDNVATKIETLTYTYGIDRLMGLEGGAAASYFKAYTSLFPESLGLKKRIKRPPGDPVNALLSLTYTMLHFESVREVEVIGLDPYIGFYHQFEYGRESLACDIVEPYRPYVDEWIWKLFRDRIFTNRDFTSGEERPGCYLKKGGRSRYYKLYEEWMQSVRSMLREDVQSLARRVMDGEDIVSE